MKISLNRVYLAGNLTRDPEMKYLPSGQPVCDFTIATTNKWVDKQTGEKKEATVFISVKAWGKKAEIAAEQLRKGSPVMVEGELSQDRWETNEGQKREKTRVTANNVHILEWRTEKDGQPKGGEPLVVPDKTDLPEEEVAF